jgi:FtsP/CotA-like multicopper oxidase with cupredoxin domain
MKALSPANGRIRAALIVFAMAQACLIAQASASGNASNRVAPVSNPCPRFTAGSAIQTPPSLSSSNGVLSVNFSYQTVTDSHGRQLYCFMTPNGLENPTLQVNPGDHLVITVTNNTSGGMNPMQLNPPNCGDSTMNTASLNIHYHGTNTSPTCGQDEVIKTIINPGETFQYNVAFPTNEPPGLYWYHPHVHGIAEHALLGGASGAIVVGGMNNVQPAVAGLPQQILVVRDQNQVQGISEGSGPCTTNNVPFQDLTINNVPIDSFQPPQGGNVTFTPAIIDVPPNQQQYWRLTNSSADTILDLQVNFDGVPQTLQIVALDGVAVNSQDGTQPGQPIPVTHFRLPPASRMEFIVNTPSQHVKLAQLITNQIDTGPNGDCDPTRPILTIVSQNDAQSAVRMGKFTHYNTQGQRFAGLAQAAIAQYRTVFFDENQNTNQFFMAVKGQPEQVFNPNAPPAITAQQGTVEQWTVENHAQENHEFHFHQVHFLVLSQNNFQLNGHVPGPPVIGQYLDMLEVPGWDGNTNHPFPSVTLLIDYRGHDVGNFVFHCHILNHEDLGMMNIIQVVQQDDAKKTDPSNPNVAVKTPAAAPGQSSPEPMQMPMNTASANATNPGGKR